MKDFLKEIEKRILIHDGSKGYMLQKLGMRGGECGELWNLTNRDAVMSVYRSYLEAGSDVIQTNTFPGNRIHLSKFGLEDKTYEINYWGAKLAREIADAKSDGEVFVCASIGPSGMLFEPYGGLTFAMAYEIYREQVKAVVDGGADIINFETFTDIAELRAACLAAKNTAKLPVICSLAFESNGRTLMGTDPFIATLVLKSAGADMVGSNCSLGPDHMVGIVRGFYEAGAGYLSVKPNAGLPCVINDDVVYEETPEHFAELASQFARYGARLIGGCCGTTPEHIKALKGKLGNLRAASVKSPPPGIITSTMKYLEAEKINPDNIGYIVAGNDQGLTCAIERKDMSYVEETAIDMASEGFEAVYVNLDGIPGENELLPEVIDRIQWYVREPLIVETYNIEALNSVLRIYRGVAGVVINRKAEENDALYKSLEQTAKKYGSVIIERPFRKS